MSAMPILPGLHPGAATGSTAAPIGARDALATGHLEPIVDELSRALDGTYPVAVLYREAERARSQLSGSISLESLPEMVIRLVRVRLMTHRGPAGAAPVRRARQSPDNGRG